MKSISIAIVDDHVLLRQGLIALFQEIDQINVLFEAGNGQDMLDNLKTYKPDIILLDIEMPIMGGQKALSKAQELYPNISIIILSAYYQESFINQYIALGAKGFLPKECSIETIVTAINEVFENGYYFDDRVSPALVEELKRKFKTSTESQFLSLTPQERKIIKLFCIGKSARLISEELFVSKRTVEWHKENIYRKLDIKSTGELIRYAILNGIITEKELRL